MISDRLISFLSVNQKSNTLFGKVEFIHKSGSHSSAFEIFENIILDIFLPRKMSATSAYIDIFKDGDYNPTLRSFGVWIGIEQGYDRYRFALDKGILDKGLYFINPIFCSNEGIFYGEYVSCGSLKFLRTADSAGGIQLTICSFEYTEPSSLAGGIIYHVFVDRFSRGGNAHCDGDDIILEGEWSSIPEYPEYPGAPLKNNIFYGGTLTGLTSKLDYIRSIGANCIFLSPIFESASNHRYDTKDYMHVDSMLGGDSALCELIKNAKERGITVILDGVFNHTGADSIYFDKYSKYDSLGAYESVDSPYYKWYNFKEYPHKYECWWDIDILPRINPDEQTCGEYFIGPKGVISKYRDMGIYGFRLDVADELSDSFISAIRSRLSNNGEAVLYGEVWEDASNKTSYNIRKKYYQGRELDGVMNYPLRRGIIDYIAYKKCDSLCYALTDIINNAPERILNYQMNLLGSHDTERILTVLSNLDTKNYSNAVLKDKRLSLSEREIAIRRLKAAYTIVATLPGIPTVFYGDEAGLEGYGDPFNRMPYPWGNEQSDLLDHYRKIGWIRRNNILYEKGAFELIHLDKDLLAFKRHKSDATHLTVYNNSEKNIHIDLPHKAFSLIKGIEIQKITLSPENAEIIKL